MTTLAGALVERRPMTAARTAVPWLTVLPLAVVMAYADGFWTTSLRGAVGSIERAQEPFASWLRESTLVLPVFVFAVLGALMLAQRWFGPLQRKSGRLAATGLLVAAAGTLAALADQLANSVYDYRLQHAHVQMMGSMRQTCFGACVVHEQHATLILQLKSLGFGAAILLVTNLLIVGWVVALRGGRLSVGTADDAGRGSRLDSLRLLVAAGLVGSGLVHAAVVPEHLAEWTAAGVFFVVLTAAELGAAALLLARPDRVATVATGILSAGPLAVWLCSRTVGLPFGPEAGVPEAIGLADLAACALEVGTLVAAVVLLRAGGWLRRPAPSANAGRLALVAVVAVAAVGLGGSGVALFDVVHRNVPDMNMTHQ
jgi:hypothetical protein